MHSLGAGMQGGEKKVQTIDFKSQISSSRPGERQNVQRPEKCCVCIVSSCHHAQCCVSSLAASIVQTAARRRVSGCLTDRRDAHDDAAHDQDTTDDAGEQADSGTAPLRSASTRVTVGNTREGANDQDDDASDQEKGRYGFIVPSCAWPCIQACIRSLIEVACFH